MLVGIHTINELWVRHDDRLRRRHDLLRRLARLVAPGGRVLLVEPALTATANDSIGLRDALVRDGWSVLSPCTFGGSCPALPKGTCHAEVAWDPPPALTRIAHAARIGKEALAFSYFQAGTESGAKQTWARMSRIDPALASRYPLFGSASTATGQARAGRVDASAGLFGADWVQ